MIPERDGYRLAEWAEEEYFAFSSEYERRGCTCFISPPCGYCTHPGNPLNLEETDDAWVPDLVGAEGIALELLRALGGIGLPITNSIR